MELTGSLVIESDEPFSSNTETCFQFELIGEAISESFICSTETCFQLGMEGKAIRYQVTGKFCTLHYVLNPLHESKVSALSPTDHCEAWSDYETRDDGVSTLAFWLM
jgi:hypothetical protein